MNTFGRKVFLIPCIAVGILVPAGCSEDPDIAPRPTQDSGEPADGGELEAGPTDASIADVVADRQIRWDSGTDGGAPIVLEMWTRGLVYCARVQRPTGTTVDCWGNNTSGELGRGAVSKEGTTYTPFPIQAPEAASFRKLVNNESFLNGMQCAVTEGNDLKCWGSSYDGLSPITPSVPAEPFLPNVVDLAMSDVNACALRTDGHVACWGGNTNGQLGIGTQDYVNHPVPEEIANFTADQVSCSAAFTCAVKSGEVWCWGSEGLLGNGPAFGWRTTPGLVAGLSGIKKVQVAQVSTFALANDKTVWFWGIVGSTTAYTPVKLLDPTPEDPNHVLSDVEDIAGTCMRFSNGKVRCLSVKQSGAYELATIPRVEDTTSLSDDCALSSAGVLRCWGYNSTGQLGLPPSVLSSTTGSLRITF